MYEESRPVMIDPKEVCKVIGAVRGVKITIRDKTEIVIETVDDEHFIEGVRDSGSAKLVVVFNGQ